MGQRQYEQTETVEAEVNEAAARMLHKSSVMQVELSTMHTVEVGIKDSTR